MHPSFGIDYICPSTRWQDIMKGPSRAAVMAHTYKVLHYGSLSEPGRTSSAEDKVAPAPDESRTDAMERRAPYAEAA